MRVQKVTTCVVRMVHSNVYFVCAVDGHQRAVCGRPHATTCEAARALAGHLGALRIGARYARGSAFVLVDGPGDGSQTPGSFLLAYIMHLLLLLRSKWVTVRYLSPISPPHPPGCSRALWPSA